MTDTTEAMGALDLATTRYDETKAAHEEAREAAVVAVLAALRAGVGPTVVADRSPFTAAHVRKLARDAEIPPAKPGKKPAPKKRTR